jgi:hypothetical protein
MAVRAGDGLAEEQFDLQMSSSAGGGRGVRATVRKDVDFIQELG